MICTFFGHRDTPETIQPQLETLLIDLINHHKAKMFYVGNHGNFDHIVRRTLKKLKGDFPQISYAVVLAYRPTEKKEKEFMDFSNTIYPFGLEKTPLRYAINQRNKWMIEKADTVITYVRYGGGAAKFKEMAEKKNKKVIAL